MRWDPASAQFNKHTINSPYITNLGLSGASTAAFGDSVRVLAFPGCGPEGVHGSRLPQIQHKKASERPCPEQSVPLNVLGVNSVLEKTEAYSK